MKILISTTSDISAILIKGQGQSLVNKGHEVIYSTHDGKAARDLTAKENMTFAPIPFCREINLFKDIYCLVLACRILAHHKPDIVNAGTPKAGLIYMLAAKIMNIKIRIFTLRGLRGITLSGFKGKIVKLFERISCSSASNILAISPSLKDEVVRLKMATKNKVKVLSKGSSNGVDLKRFCISKEIIDNSKKIKIKLGITDNTFIFGFVGRLVKDKGVEELIIAFEELQIRYKAKLFLVGDFEENNKVSENIKNRIEQNIDIIKINITSEIPLYTYIFDILLLPSYREGFGNVVIEAAAMGTPAIVSNIPGAKDAIENNLTGLLIKPQSSKDILEAMIYYIENPTILKQHGINAKRRVETSFENSKIWEEQERYYKELNV